MSHPSFKTDAEIRLLTKMLTDNFHEEDQLFPGEPLRTSECPAPALLCALFEPSAKDSAWTVRMREHVENCSECRSLIKPLKRFAAASEDHVSISANDEAAWRSAEKRMERNIRKRLPIHPKPKRARWWSFEWLPSMAMVYTLGGSAAALLIFCAATVFLAGNKPPTASNQLARTEADIWTHPAPQRPGAEPAIGLGSTESSERFPANTARDEPHSVEREATPAGEPRPNSQPVPAIPVLPGETGRPSARSGIIAASSENASASVHRVSVELSAGMLARIQILLARQESGSTIVEAALTTPSSTTAPSVIFSARVAEDSAPVRLQIHMLEQDGRRMSLHDGEINSVIVRWPDSERKPLPGQSFEVQVLSGATLESQAERK